MAQLNSPGVVVTVVDESFYTPAAPSTVPLVIVATEENKPNGANTGVAPGTLKANAGLAYLITSQRDLSETFGIAAFKTDANNNPIHAGEQNEYGLHAAYSYLGVSNRAYVVRADIDLGSINAKSTAPQAAPKNGTYWLDISKSTWGIFEWNGDPKGTGLGQTFVKRTPIIINDTRKVVDYEQNDYIPKPSVGAIGDYAVVTLMDLDTDYNEPDTIWYKSPGNAPWGSVEQGKWVQVGSEDWIESWPVAVSSKGDISGADTKELMVAAVDNSFTDIFTIAGTTATTIATNINAYSSRIKAGVTKNGRLALFLQHSIRGIRLTGTALEDLGFTAGELFRPLMTIGPHTVVNSSLFKTPTARPTGSLWIKSTEVNGGSELAFSKYNADNDAWETVKCPLYSSGRNAIYNLDKRGGLNIPAGTLYAKYNDPELKFQDSDASASIKVYRKRANGVTKVVSKKIGIDAIVTFPQTIFIQIGESEAGVAASDYNLIEIDLSLENNSNDADLIAQKINNAGFLNIIAEVDSQNRVVINHKLGGEIIFRAPSFLESFFGGEVNPNLYPAPDALSVPGSVTLIGSLWEPLRYTASATAPTSLTNDGTLWYNSLVDEVDIMVHNGTRWVGYRTTDGFPTTDINGPQVRATAPITQSDGSSPLVDNDLWIDTSDIDAYPKLYRFDNAKSGPVTKKWVLVDNTDQSSEDGVTFFDARWSTRGEDKDQGRIVELLLSNHVDPDCPDPALYPKGMLLWNMRRSGFNVKKFVHNYIDTETTNKRLTVFDSNTGNSINPAMTNYYPHRWVTVSGNNPQGVGNFGRIAQRRVVVNALQAVVNSSTDIREEARVINLLACPGYPELIGELINLNYDRGLTAFIVGDSPARLTPDASSLKEWGDNIRLSFEDNEIGAASYDEYMAMFYPWGLTSDNFGRNVVVPPSHMMLRTIALSDSVSFPWFAPAGTRRGGITNASAVGFVDDEGEFVTVALNTGQRDTLYEVKINPITFFTGVGLVNFGQKTRAKVASALDRINVARLVVYLRRQLDILAKPYIFEPNDKITRDEIKGAVESLMLELVGQRALYDYIVVCDESNNTPARIDRNELYVDIAIEPVKAVEFIYIPLRLKNTGEIGAL
jgi:hypothetical protein